jgi:hypothetical protein
LVCSVDFDEIEMKSVYDPNSSLKLSMGLPPIETSHARIDVLFDIKSGKIKQVEIPSKETFAKAYVISFYSMPREDAIGWLNSQFGTSVQ